MRSFVVTVDEAAAELAADRLWQLGVRAVEERPAAAGLVELWTAVGEDEASIAAAASMLDTAWRWRTEVEPDVHPEVWRDHARPMAVGDRLLVVPAWQQPSPVDVSTAGRITIAIEPGAAFGLGDHPTTALTLAALDREMAGHEAPAVLDVGCGTGVLSVAAAKLGSGRVRAVDIAPAAVEATRDNAERNGVSASIDVDATPAPELDGHYDIVVANILAPVLISIADDLRRLTAGAGRLVVSGILAGAHGHVLEALAPMVVVGTDTSEGWAAVTLAHR